MTTASTTTRPENAASAATILADRRALIRDVDRRALPVLALLDRRVWPYAELGTLTVFVRDKVLIPASSGHARLRALTVQLERARSEPCAPDQVRSLVDELSATLREQMPEEQRERTAAVPRPLAGASAP